MKLAHAPVLTLLIALCLPCAGAQQAGASGQHASPPADSANAPNATQPTHKPTNVLFSAPLQDVPGKQLVVVGLELKPGGQPSSLPHRHPGSVYVYVTRGTARLGIDGQSVQVVHTGESFFEPPGALHTVAESASQTESATAIAVMIVPNGAPLLTVEPRK